MSSSCGGDLGDTLGGGGCCDLPVICCSREAHASGSTRGMSDGREHTNRRSWVLAYRSGPRVRPSVRLDEMSAAVGHAPPETSKRHYGHFVRKIFNPALQEGVPGGR